MTKKHTEAAVRHSDFVIPWTFVIRHSSFSEFACPTKEGVVALRVNPPAKSWQRINPEFP
jgi:hypothetical protein